MDKQLQFFGGDWTQKKLAIVFEYLQRYVTALGKQPFSLWYIDAFAGTGYREAPEAQSATGFFSDELADVESQAFLDGSATMALRVSPAFDRYVFIEKSLRRFEELQRLKIKFPALSDNMAFLCGDANAHLQDLCQEDWIRSGRRGVVFLDPFGMQIDWATVEAIARTRAIDTWILFPAGIGVMRLLPRDGQIPDTWKARLDRVFGTREWYNRFYREKTYNSFFGEVKKARKVCSFNAIADFYLERLRMIFADVARNPCVLPNSRGIPLFLFCFAVGNPKGAPIAMRIAEHILGKSQAS